MITPPPNAIAFYTAIFDKDAAKFVIGLVAKPFAFTDDIDQVLISSTDFTNDIEPAAEVEAGTLEVVSHIVEEDDMVETETKYNPLFLPNVENMFELAELDNDGDLIEIDGFQNPFLIMTMKHSTDEFPDVVEAKVVYKKFDLPTMHEALAPKEILLS